MDKQKFKADLIQNTDQVLKDMDLNGRQGEHVVVVENTEAIHNLIVCTLCSCYPWPLLGLPPAGTSQMHTEVERLENLGRF